MQTSGRAEKTAPARIQKRMKKQPNSQLSQSQLPTSHSNSSGTTVALNAKQPVILRPFPHFRCFEQTPNPELPKPLFPIPSPPRPQTLSTLPPPQKKENFFHFLS